MCFFLDLDCTLMINGMISEINRKAIVKARENGHYVSCDASDGRVSTGLENYGLP